MGIKRYDIVIGIAGKNGADSDPISDPDVLIALMKAKNEGDVVNLYFWIDAKQDFAALDVTVGKHADPPRS